MERRKLALPALLALAFAACQPAIDDGNVAIDNGLNAAEVANAEIETLPPSETSALPGENAAPSGIGNTGSGTRDQAMIPSQYHGRWGLVAADCTSTRGDAKGLITIGEGTVKFYESLATLKEQRPAIATSFSGHFGFTGEGQTWEKVMTFTRTGDSLKRADDEGSFTYTRCA